VYFLATFFRAGGTMVLSLVLGALSLGYTGYYYPEILDSMLTIASSLKDMLTNSANTGISSGFNIWLKFLIHEQTFVLMFFVLMARLVIVVFTSLLGHFLLPNR
jgi:hypothetical protein